jgi:hypothetical protein
MNFLSLNCLTLNINLKIKIGPSFGVVQLVDTYLQVGRHPMVGQTCSDVEE